jgi:hypothetical protein
MAAMLIGPHHQTTNNNNTHIRLGCDGAHGSILSHRVQLLYKMVLISCSLYEKLLEASAYVLGTVRLHSSHMPEELKKESSN